MISEDKTKKITQRIERKLIEIRNIVYDEVVEKFKVQFEEIEKAQKLIEENQAKIVHNQKVIIEALQTLTKED